MAEADPPRWYLRTRHLTLDRPLLVGVVNVTPDSFSDGGFHADTATAVAHAQAMAAAGADLVDVGGESTRPGAEPVEEAQEMERILPVVEALAAEGLVVSVDTTKPKVAEEACRRGAEVINDVTAAAIEGMPQTMAATGAGVVLMHMQGNPKTMQVDPRYDDVVVEVRDHLVARAAAVERAGVNPRAIVVDPGIGFGKTLEHNLELLRSIARLVATGYPVMVGASRKGFLGKIGGIERPRDRDMATAAVTALVVAAGAAMVRVHDVPSSLQAAQVAHAISRHR